MFSSLAENMQDVFKDMSGRGRLSEEQVEAGLKEMRRVLLAADVHYEVAQDLIDRIKDEALEEEIMEDLTPAQQLVKITEDKLEEILGGDEAEIDIGQGNPTSILLVGLQGTGKTTTCAKLGHHYKQEGHSPLLLSTDDQRPAGPEQLQQLAEENGLNFYPADLDRVENELENAADEAGKRGDNPLIIDTAGRLSINEPMIEQTRRFQNLLPDTVVLLVLDGMMGQEALQVAEDFDEQLALDGLILTKMEGDARGGAAISAKERTGVPIYFVGVGERVEHLQRFYPERMAQRVIGMGDMQTLIEEAEEKADQEVMEEQRERMMEGRITMEDVKTQLEQLQNMGSLKSIIDKLPGGFEMKDRMDEMGVDEDDVDHLIAIIQSMTDDEKQNPDIIDGSRRERIAQGSGTSRQKVNQLLQRYNRMKDMLEKLQDNEDMMEQMMQGGGPGPGGLGGNLFG